jgi:hypothetical protein
LPKHKTPQGRKKNEMATLDKKSILEAQDITKELVSVPEWGGDVWVKSLTGAERDQFEASIVQMKGSNMNFNMSNIRAKLASLSLCDDKGVRLFTSDAEVKLLSGKSSQALQRVFKVAQKLSGIGEEEIQELTKGLEENPLGGSVSD